MKKLLVASTVLALLSGCASFQDNEPGPDGKHRRGQNAYLCVSGWTNTCNETIEVHVYSNQICNGGFFTLRPRENITSSLTCNSLMTYDAIFAGY